MPNSRTNSDGASDGCVCLLICRFRARRATNSAAEIPDADVHWHTLRSYRVQRASWAPPPTCKRQVTVWATYGPRKARNSGQARPETVTTWPVIQIHRLPAWTVRCPTDLPSWLYQLTGSCPRLMATCTVGPSSRCGNCSRSAHVTTQCRSTIGANSNRLGGAIPLVAELARQTPGASASDNPSRMRHKFARPESHVL